MGGNRTGSMASEHEAICEVSNRVVQGYCVSIKLESHSSQNGCDSMQANISFTPNVCKTSVPLCVSYQMSIKTGKELFIQLF